MVGVSPHFRLEGVIGIDEDLCFDLMENSIERPLTSKALVKRKFSGDELFPDKGDLHFDVLESSIQGAKKPKPTLAPFTFVNMNKPDICFPLKLDGDLGFDLLQKFECQRQEWAFSAMTRTGKFVYSYQLFERKKTVYNISCYFPCQETGGGGVEWFTVTITH